MSEPCAKCPIPEHCLRRKEWCAWMGAENPDPQHVRHIIGRSKLAAGIDAGVPVDWCDGGQPLAIGQGVGEVRVQIGSAGGATRSPCDLRRM